MINPTPKAPNLGAALSGAAQRKIELAYEQGHQDGCAETRRQLQTKRIIGAVASLAAMAVFDLGRHRNWW